MELLEISVVKVIRIHKISSQLLRKLGLLDSKMNLSNRTINKRSSQQLLAFISLKRHL